MSYYEDDYRDIREIMNSRSGSSYQKAINSANIVYDKSVGSNKRTIASKKRKTNMRKSLLSKKFKNRLIIISMALAASIVIGSATVAISPNLGFGDISKGEDFIITGMTENDSRYKEAMAGLRNCANKMLVENNLGKMNEGTGQIEFGENSIEDYKRMDIVDINSDKDVHALVYVLKEIMPDEEFHKFIKSVNHGGIYYEDAVNFYRLNGYMDNYNASEEVFDNYMQSYIMENGNELLEMYSQSDTAGRSR